VAARAAGATTEVPLVVGDVIRDLNGKPMTTLDTLRSALRSLPPGAPVTIQLQREVEDVGPDRYYERLGKPSPNGREMF